MTKHPGNKVPLQVFKSGEVSELKKLRTEVNDTRLELNLALQALEEVDEKLSGIAQRLPE